MLRICQPSLAGSGVTASVLKPHVFSNTRLQCATEKTTQSVYSYVQKNKFSVAKKVG